MINNPTYIMHNCHLSDSISSKIPNNWKLESSWCQIFCHHWRHRRLSLRQPLVSPVTTNWKLASCQLSVSSDLFHESVRLSDLLLSRAYDVRAPDRLCKAQQTLVSLACGRLMSRSTNNTKQTQWKTTTQCSLGTTRFTFATKFPQWPSHSLPTRKRREL